MDLQQEDFHQNYLFQEDIHKTESIGQEENMREGLTESKQKKVNMKDENDIHENENFIQEEKIQQDGENSGEQNDINQEQENIYEQNSNHENNRLAEEKFSQEEHTNKEEEDIKQEEELKYNENMNQQVKNTEDEMIDQEEKVTSKEEVNNYQGNGVNNKDEEIIIQEEDLNIDQDKKLKNKEEEIIQKEEENVNLEEKILSYEEENSKQDISQERKTNNEEEILTHEEKEITQEDISLEVENINQEERISEKQNEEDDISGGNANQETENLDQVNNSEEEKSIHKQEIVNHEEKIISHEEEIISHEEEIMSHDEKIMSHEEQIMSHEEQIMSHEEEIMSHDEKIMSHEEQIMSHEEEIMSNEEEIMSNEEQIMSHEEEIMSHEEEIISHEKEIISHEEELIHNGEKEIGQEITNEEEKNINCRENVINGRADDLNESNAEPPNLNQENIYQEQQKISDEQKIIAPEVGKESGPPNISQEEENISYGKEITNQEGDSITEKNICQEDDTSDQVDVAISPDEDKIIHEKENPSEVEENISDPKENFNQEDNATQNVVQEENFKDEVDHFNEEENIENKEQSLNQENENFNEEHTNQEAESTSIQKENAKIENTNPEAITPQEKENAIQEKENINEEEKTGLDMEKGSPQKENIKKEDNTRKEEENGSQEIFSQEKDNISEEVKTIIEDKVDNLEAENASIQENPEKQDTNPEAIAPQEKDNATQEKQNINEGKGTNLDKDNGSPQKENIKEEDNTRKEEENRSQETFSQEKDNISEEVKAIIEDKVDNLDVENTRIQENSNKEDTNPEVIAPQGKEDATQEKENVNEEERTNLDKENGSPEKENIKEEDNTRQEEENISEETFSQTKDSIIAETVETIIEDMVDNPEVENTSMQENSKKEDTNPEAIVPQEKEDATQEKENVNEEERSNLDKENGSPEKENIKEEDNTRQDEEIISQETFSQMKDNIIPETVETIIEDMVDNPEIENTTMQENSKNEDTNPEVITPQEKEDVTQEKSIDEGERNSLDKNIKEEENTTQDNENISQEPPCQEKDNIISDEVKTIIEDKVDNPGVQSADIQKFEKEDTNLEPITPQENEKINENGRTNLDNENSSLEKENISEAENTRQEDNIIQETFNQEEENIIQEEAMKIKETSVNKLEGEIKDIKQDTVIPALDSIPKENLNYQHKKKLNLLQSLDLEEYFWGPNIKNFHDKLRDLNLEKFQTSKLTLIEVLKIGQEDLKMTIPQRTEDVPWHFLRRLMALNRTARNTRLNQSQDTRTHTTLDEDMDFIDDVDNSTSIHPLDVLYLLLNCSDSFLQQEMLTKMSMCQFALPLLLPAGQSFNITFMLWAMRDIVKRWRPQSLAHIKGCMEENLVNIPMPVFSFARLGKCTISKSRILNYITSPVQQHHDFFVHQNMEGANILREVSDGLVEISWHFPGGSELLDLFPDPVAVTNLRGDLESNWNQFNFLTKVSSAVFIFIESMDDQGYSVLSNIEESNTNYFIILAPSSRCISIETQNYIKMLYPVLKINRKNVLVKNNAINDAELVKKLQLIIGDLIKSSPYYITLEEMSHIAADLGIQVDEGSEEHQNTRTLALEITKDVKDVVQYKNEMMTLQGEYWKQLSRIEKEMCRMKGMGSENAEDYRAKLVKKCAGLRRQQSECSIPNGILTFIAALKTLPRIEKHYFLKWMKLYLDSVTRKHLSALQAEYKNKYYKVDPDVDRLKELDQIILNSSLGVEHFIREVSQFYEAETFLSKDCTSEQKLNDLPSIAADLLLDGFPLELIDGDASNIPMQWINDVLNELDTKTGGQCRLKVITVLGVQSTGKSTLLNTMFGLQFPVASGRCTRGAFMTLLKVKDNLLDELGCELILVIDTEGLKAPELASVEDSYEHDNELATFVVGLSDITIINMAMENTAEIKDILQIVVHAFLRMKELGKKTNCQFVHQNVSDVSAYDKNMRDRKKLLEQLDEMTNVASRMEEKSNMTKFSDVMDYDLEKHSWYIPGLLHGVSPMASVNTGYSENILELKRQLFDTMKKQLESRTPQSISDFNKWIKNLWNAVKYEKFIFSFRNSLVAEAYNQLSIKYSELEWNFRKRMHKWIIEAENEILNQPASELETDIWAGIKEDMYQVLQEEERVMQEGLEEYFESGNKYVHLIERYREDFFRSVTTLRKEVEDNFTVKCEEALRIQKGKHEIQFVQNSYLRIIEEKATSLLDNCQNVKHQLSDEELKSEFEVMWNKTISGLHFSSLKKHNVSQEMIDQLRKDMRHKAGYINEKLNDVKSLDDYGETGLDLDKKYTQSSWYENMPEVNDEEYWNKVDSLVASLKEECNQHVTEQVNTMKDYDQTYCQELLNFVNERLNEEDVRSLHLTPLFELDLKLLLLGHAAPIFQKKHNIFFQENNMKSYLENIKPQYFSTFKNVYQKKDESKVRAQKFCEVCLKPALSDYVYKNLGGEIVNDILTSGDSISYSTRTFFQYTLLKELLEDHNYDYYVKYNNRYETFVKNWIVKFITNKYKDSTSLESLKSKILACISRKVRQTLKDPRVQETSSVSECLKTFCLILKKDLVILQNEMKVIVFQNNASPVQFSVDIEEFLEVVEKEIITEIKHFTIEYVLNKTTLKPQDELFKKVFGCGKQCPFCKAPCEAGAANHKEHFASVHRPQGLGTYRCKESQELSHSICTTDVVGSGTFLNSDTDWKQRLYKDYRQIYPDWTIQPDATIGASNYWKYVFKEFNKQFSDYYSAKPATLPEDWNQITKEQALQNLKESFNMN